VNYLISSVEEGTIYTEALTKHKEHIEFNLKKFSGVPRIWSKYLWVANYHNYFCQLVKGYVGYSPSLLVDEKLAVQHPKRLIE
jgi:hypothetical protein